MRLSVFFGRNLLPDGAPRFWSPTLGTKKEKTVKLLLTLFAAMVLVGCGGQGEVEMPENTTPPPPPGSMTTADDTGEDPEAGEMEMTP